MKKNYLLLTLLMIIGSFGMANAQSSYKLSDLSASEFEAGGNSLWSFEKYDVASGTYSLFTTYGDEGRVNYFDRYNPERYGSYPIMSNPETLSDPYPRKRFSWYNSSDEYLYVGRDYPDGTECVNLEYWTSIPSELKGYEVYSSASGTGGSYCNSAITFTVPADGYYKVDMSVLREDNIRVDPMTVIQRYRYGGKNNVADVIRINQSFTYGVGGEVSGTDLPAAPESPAVGLVRYAAQAPVSKFFYIYAKAGDKISFETDSRSTNNPESAIRGVWARTKWTNLAIAETDENTAKADLTLFVDPYTEDPSVFEALDDLLYEAETLISNHNGNNYPNSARDALQSVYEKIDAAYTDIHAMEVAGFVQEMQIAIDNYLASAYGMKIRYTFDNVTDNIVTDESGSGYDGTLYNEASVQEMGKYKVLSLGSGTGYLDMSEKPGNVIATMNNYTISAYFRVNEDEALSGNGHFLWTFSSLATNSASAGQYIYYRVPNNRYVVTGAGWGSEKALQPADLSAEKGSWQHIVFRQTGNKSEMFINGELMDAVTDSLHIPNGTFTAATPYNWLGRPAFSGDNYLKNTLVYDFRLYNLAVDDAEITEWAALVSDLEAEMLSGTGDLSELQALIDEYKGILADATVGDGIGQHSEISKLEFEDAISMAEEFVDAGKGSQIVIDEQASKLKAAYATFLASKNTIMAYPDSEPSFQSGIYYIQVGDYFLTVPETGTNNTYLQIQPYIDNPEKLNNNQVWNVQYNSTYSNLDAENPFALFSIVSDKVVWEGDGNYHLDELGRMKEGGTSVAQSADNSNYTWREHLLFFDGTAYSIANHYYWNRGENAAITFPNETENETPSRAADKKFQFVFRTVDDVVKEFSGIESVNANKAIVYGSAGEIIISGATPGTAISVYDFSGRLVKSSVVNSNRMQLNIASGLYIVKVANQVNKVIVR